MFRRRTVFWKLLLYAIRSSPVASFGVTVTFVVSGAVISRKVWNYLQWKHLKDGWEQMDKDLVILHQFRRATSCPSPSPFCLKLETFLRFADLKYVNDFSEFAGPKGKLPWITIDDTEVPDSQLAMEYLTEKFNLKIDTHLSELQKAQSRVLRTMLEDHFYWALIMEHYVYTGDRTWLERFGKPENVTLPPYLRSWANYFQNTIVYKTQAWSHGMGRHSMSEVRAQGLRDLQAASVLLGDQDFLFGDAVSEVDCTLFAFVSMVLDVCLEDCIYAQALQHDFRNLKAFYARMKKRYWKDWDNCVAKTGIEAQLQ